MGQEEMQEFSSPLPVLPRLKAQAKSVVRRVEAEDQCKNLSSVLEEVQHKGTLMDRLEMLENRALQLSLEMDVEKNSRSSSSSFLGPEKRRSLVLQNHVQEFPR